MISEELINKQDNIFAENMINDLKERNNKISLEKLEIDETIQKINELENYILQKLLEMKDKYLKLWEILNEEISPPMALILLNHTVHGDEL